MTDLEECVLFLRLELVGTENAKTALGFLISKTSLRAVEKFKHILDHNCLQINLLLVVEVLSLELDLRGEKGSLLSHAKSVGGLKFTLDISTLASASGG